MKKFLATAFGYSTIAFLLFFLQGCLKDKVTRTYTIMTPVYESKATVLANIKSDAPGEVGSPGKIFIYSNYIFLNEPDKGVHIIDNSNPSNPVVKSFLPIPGNVDIAVKGNTLYADMYTDLLAIDISDPLNAKLLKTVADVFPERTYDATGMYSTIVPDKSKVIVGWIKKDTTVSGEPYVGSGRVLFEARADFAMNKAAVSIPGIGGSLARFSIVNDYLYAVDYHTLKSISITDPSNPTLINNIPGGFDIETIYPFKDKLFVGSMTGLYIFDITNPASPAMKSTFSHARACDPVVADDNYAFVTLKEGTRCGPAENELLVLNVTNVTAPTLLKKYSMQNPSGLAKDGNTLFVCDGTGGLKVFNATDALNITLTKQIKGIEPHDIIAWRNNALVIAKEGLFQFDYSNVDNIYLRSKITVSK
jgi:hypothetical protein